MGDQESETFQGFLVSRLREMYEVGPEGPLRMCTRESCEQCKTFRAWREREIESALRDRISRALRRGELGQRATPATR